eukprot:537359-Alexandrium_andersonii.AAC.1
MGRVAMGKLVLATIGDCQVVDGTTADAECAVGRMTYRNTQLHGRVCWESRLVHVGTLHTR